MKFDLRTELTFLLSCLAGYSLLFWIFSRVFGHDMTLDRYTEAAIVILLVCYLFRFVFIVLKRL